MFSLSHKDLTKLKMCIYLFCNFSERFNCKGNVKSMYSDYASGIAFLIKIQSLKSNKKGYQCILFVRNRLDVLVWRFEWQIIKCTLTYQGLAAARRVRLRPSGVPACMHVSSMGLDKKRRPWFRFESFCEVCCYTCPLLTKLHNIFNAMSLLHVSTRGRKRHTRIMSGWTKLMFDYLRENATYFFQVWYTTSCNIWHLNMNSACVCVCVGGHFNVDALLKWHNYVLESDLSNKNWFSTPLWQQSGYFLNQIFYVCLPLPVLSITIYDKHRNTVHLL